MEGDVIGFRMLPIAPPVDELRNFVAADGDVFVASWPKSGTTWMQAIVAHLLAPDRSWSHVSQVTPFFDVAASFERGTHGLQPTAAIAERFAARGRRAWNTHLLWSLAPKHEGARYIYVVRDGRDAIVSFWYHLRNQRGDAGTFEGSLESFVQQIANRELPYGKWAAHVADWARAADDERVLFVRYDDMKADLAGVARRVARHLGVRYSDAVLRCCTFEAMRADEARYEPQSVQWAPGFRFLRKGGSGDGRRTLAPQSAAVLDADFQAYCAPLHPDVKRRLFGDDATPDVDADPEQPLVPSTTDYIVKEIV